jgi:hypothetical protein
VTENNQKKEKETKTRGKERTKKSALYPIPTHADSKEIQKIKPKRRGYEQKKNEMKREPRKGRRVPNHACVHRDDRSFVVITSRWQTARITFGRSTSNAAAAVATIAVYGVCCMSYVVWSCIIPQRRGTSSNPSCRVCWGQRRNSRVGSGWSKEKKINPYPYPPPSPFHPTSSRSTTLSSHLSCLLLPPPLPPPLLRPLHGH